MKNYDDGLWHGWNGGECPVHPDTVIEAIFHDGSGSGESVVACDIDWDYLWPVVFRVIKEHKEPREFWLRGSTYHHTYVSNSIHVREVIQ